MRLSFRLAELHNYTPDPKKRPGVIKTICDHTGLDRHQVAALLRNEVKHIPLDALSRLCDYLVEQGLASPEQLPGALFAVEAEHFWELLARRRRLELCLGVRRGDSVDWPDGAWVVASDSVLMGELLTGVSSLGGSVRMRDAGAPAAATPSAPPTDGGAAFGLPAAATPAAVSSGSSNEPTDAQTPSGSPRSSLLHPESLKQSLVWSPLPGAHAGTFERAQAVYQEFVDSPGDKALVCLGSTKSNPAAELVIASAFNITPFESQDEAAEPGQRGCPFFIRYRTTDPHPPSCWGGLKLSRWETTDQPGIYYEAADGRWRHCRCDGQTQDAAYVFYAYRESQGWLEMAIGGFSGRATRLLARTLTARAEEFWPPIDNGQGVRIGAFVVRYTLPPGGDQLSDLLRTDLVAQAEIIRVDDSAILRRFQAPKLKAKRPTGVKPK